ncbi:tRNA preQ1(34) S-adenosylmethionine ribosyltransferase-isomerase QueA [Chromatium okenii]|uniref:tRNA preQ1(34) S-adenosylmethionine ribosyltransferase-isomerase QueA n=1 Tax=Chromatium okenii TaxID=61644 RepID=UPI00190468BC|nr:tRNA preQ1(34) S-adenosylmethionine ribosyltransferase-isomerase QueA [Chromatium okenii]MBK1641260.1 tRNA preQ1(34) S-adenosylmethionine ribosyltransferase-isomerase QueA [Chromatium okenii]
MCFSRSDFHYDLPPELIAQYPLPTRSGSRLLALDAETAAPRDLLFTDLPQLLRPTDLLVFNNTRVMRARLFGHKATGGRVEVLIERVLAPQEALAHLRASKTPAIGSQLTLTGNVPVQVIGRDGALFRLHTPTLPIAEVMAQYGHLPLPPYIQRPDETSDAARYQTLFASRDGAVAAPTAGLHFDAALLRQLDELGIERAEVTLHVGAGTFQPLRVEDLAQHEMHAEWLEVTAQLCERIAAVRQRGGRVIAVGSTSVRSLETAAAAGELKPYCGDSRLFIRPGDRFRVVDAMITNFHLPESTLLILVAAFAGYTPIMNAYRHAVAAGYRFFSYGDAMFLTRRQPD